MRSSLAQFQMDRQQPARASSAWAPGHPMIIENQLVIDGEWIERNGVTTFNLYRPPTLKHVDPRHSGPSSMPTAHPRKAC